MLAVQALAVAVAQPVQADVFFRVVDAVADQGGDGAQHAVGSARRVPRAIHHGLRRALEAMAPALAPQGEAVGLGDAEINQAHNKLLSVLLRELVHRGGACDAGVSISPGQRWRVVRRAEEFLEASDSPTVRIDDLCIAACISLSRLESAFCESFGVSPRAFSPCTGWPQCAPNCCVAWPGLLSPRSQPAGTSFTLTRRGWACRRQGLIGSRRVESRP